MSLADSIDYLIPSYFDPGDGIDYDSHSDLDLDFSLNTTINTIDPYLEPVWKDSLDNNDEVGWQVQ